MTDKWSERQLAFCNEYLVDLNGTQAAIRAGYKAKSARKQARRLLDMPQVEKRIVELKAARVERTEITADAVVARLWEIVNTNPAEILTRKLDDWPQEAARSIVRIRRNNSGIEIQTEDRVRAAELLLKHVGGFEKDNKQRVGKGGLTAEVVQALSLNFLGVEVGGSTP